MTDEELKRVRIRICDPAHPHYSEFGRLTGATINLLGTPMTEIKLDHCAHGVTGCFVKRFQIMLDPERPPAHRRRRPRRER